MLLTQSQINEVNVLITRLNESTYMPPEIVLKFRATATTPGAMALGGTEFIQEKEVVLEPNEKQQILDCIKFNAERRNEEIPQVYWAIKSQQ